MKRYYIDVLHYNKVELNDIFGYSQKYMEATQQNMNNLFWPDENSIEQCFAAHIVQGCQQYFSAMLHLIAG